MNIFKQLTMKKPDTLQPFEQLVLTALLTLNQDDAYGVPIHAKACELAEKLVNFGSVYVVLDRLEDKGYVSSRTAPAPERGGKKRRYFKLEPAGQRALQETLELTRRLDAAAGDVCKPKRAK